MAKHFIQKAIKHPGVEKAAAKKAGMSTHAYMEEHKHSPGTAGRRARLGLTLESMAHRAHGGHVGPHDDTSKDKRYKHIGHHPSRTKRDFHGDAHVSRAHTETPVAPGGFEQEAPPVSAAPMDNDAPGSLI